MVAEPSDEQHRILLVDDETENLDLLASTLRRGNVLFKAGSGEEALRIVERERVHMVITDQRMPGITGTELLEILRRRDEHVIRVLITGYADMKVAVDAINRGGVHRYVSKPWDPAELRSIVASELARYDLEERAKRLTDELIDKNSELEELNRRLKEQKAEVERLALEYKEQKEIAINMGERLANTNAELLGAQEEIKQKNVKLEAANKKLERLSITDGLTGFYNKRHMHQLLESEMGRAKRYELNLSILMVDLDTFKQVNDTHGHLFGDAVLRRVTESIRRNIRETDWPTRYGGDEFVIILPHTGIDRALYLARRIHADIRSLQLATPTEEIVTPTVSIGIAHFTHETALDRDGLISLADKALYQAKQEGRNRIVVAS
ncbi:diguanylate cyclase [bacterium]|nr:diguanylate cyclase [bacterium]